MNPNSFARGWLKIFKNSSAYVIIANRKSDDLLDVDEKVYTRDLFGGDA